MKGAFKKTIRENKGKVPILANHDWNQPIGWNHEAEEDEKGLLVDGLMNVDNQLGKIWYDQVKHAMEIKARMGISIGYSVIKSMPKKDVPGVRELHEIKLWEYSIVVFPMNVEASVTSAKAMDEFDLETSVKHFLDSCAARGWEKEAVEKALRGGAAIEDFDPLMQSLNRFKNILRGETQ